MLTTEETALAKEKGWLLCDVYDTTSKRWAKQVLPTPENPVKSSKALWTVLLTRGAEGDALAKKLVNIVMASIAPATKPKPKKAKK